MIYAVSRGLSDMEELEKMKAEETVIVARAELSRPMSRHAG